MKQEKKTTDPRISRSHFVFPIISHCFCSGTDDAAHFAGMGASIDPG